MPGVYFVRQRVSANHGQRQITPVLGELLIDGERTEIVVNRALIVAYANKNMRRHMHHVSPNR